MFGTTTRGKVQSRNQFSSIRNLTSKGSFWSCDLPRLRSEIQDPEKINRVVEEFPYSVADLWECSPLRPEGMSCEHILSCLFEPDELIAAGNLAKSEVMSLKKWMHVGFDHCDLFCPNPMRGYSGINFNKKPSVRCRDNTGRRKYVVLEIDGLRLDNQASVIDFLTRVEGTTLRMVVYSGRKSLHATFDAFPNEEDNWRFISNLVTYGGDSRMYFPEQQSRLPAVARRNIRGQVERTSSGDICQRCIFLTLNINLEMSENTERKMPKLWYQAPNNFWMPDSRGKYICYSKSNVAKRLKLELGQSNEKIEKTIGKALQKM